MARGAWDPTAWTLSVMAEQSRDSELRSEPFIPGDFHPFRVQPKKSTTRSGVLPYNPEVLKQIVESGKFG